VSAHALIDDPARIFRPGAFVGGTQRCRHPT
jgi:hypothetical protein